MRAFLVGDVYKRQRYINDYIQYVKSDFLAGLGFGATQMLGENTGIFIGYSVDTGRNVYLQPSLGSQGAVSYTHLDVYKRQGDDRWTYLLRLALALITIMSYGCRSYSCLLYTSRCV